jgi:hypothetical protein
VNTDNSYTNYSQNGKNVQLSYLTVGVANGKYCTHAATNREGHLMDATMSANSAYTLETIGCTGYHSAFILTGDSGIENCYYSQHVYACKDCFGCEGLRHKQYCILNKQYTKEEYEQLVPKIIEKMKADGEWGEFFPVANSTFGYNETIAQRFYPMTKEQALARNYTWCEIDYQINIPENLQPIL